MSETAAPKPDLDEKKTILKHFFKGVLKGKLLAPKLRQSSDKSLSQPGCSHSNTIYNLQLQKTIVLRMQPRHQATLTQPLPCVSQHHVANLHVSTHITTPEHQMTTVMQPFQCDLPPEIPKHPITTHTQAHPKQLEATVTMRQKKRQTDRSRTRRTHEVPFIVGCSHFTRKNARFRAPASSPRHSPCNIMQPFQCDLQAQIPRHPITTHTQAHPKQLEATVTMRQKKKANRPQPHPPHRRGTFHRRLQPLYTEKHKVSCSGFLPKTEPLQHHAAIPMRSASTDSKTPYNYAHTSTPKAAWSHRYNAAKKKGKPTAAAPAAQTRYLSSPAAATLHGKTQGFVLRLPPQNRPLQHHAAIPMRSASTDSKTPYNYAHTQAHPKQLEATVTLRQKKKANRSQPHPPHRRGTFHRRLQPLYTEKHKVSCSGFLPKTEPLQHHAAIPMRSASTDSKTPYNYAHTSTPKAAWSHRYNAAKKKGKPTAAAPAAQTRYLSSPAAATLHGKTQGFVLRLPPENRPLQHHAAIPMRSASTDSKTPYNYAHTSTPKAAWSHRYNAAKKKGKPTAAAPAAQTRYLSSPAAATLHGKTQGFVLRLPPQNITHATFMQPFQCDLQPPFIKVKSQSHTTLQGQVSIRSASTLHQGHVKSHTTLQGQLSIAHHPSRSSLNRHHPSRSSLNRAAPFKVKSQSDLQRPFIKVMWSLTPPFKVNSQSRTTLQGQVSIAHHPSRSSLNRAPPFKVKSQSHTTLHTTLQGQVSIAHHPFSIAHHPSRSSLNRAPPFKIKSQSRTTLQGQVSIAHHPSHHPSRSSVNRAPPFLNRAPPFKVKCQSRTTLHHFKTQNSICPYLGSIASQLPLINH